MVGTWLLELYLDQLNRSMLDLKGRPQQPKSSQQQPHSPDQQPQSRNTPQPQSSEQEVQGQSVGNADGAGSISPGPDQLTQELRAFLKRHVNVLDVNVTVRLLAGYGRLDDLMEYATYRKVDALTM